LYSGNAWRLYLFQCKKLGFNMKKSQRIMTSLLLVAASLGVSVGAQAQNNAANSTSNFPAAATGRAYLDFGFGKSDYSLGNGIGVFGADQGDTAYNIHAGSYFNNNFGMELGYTDFGRVARAGGTTNADAISLSLVGKLPLGTSFNLLGKIGTTWGRTKVSANPASGIVSGDDGGFGLSYGLGAEFAITPQWSAVLQYESYNLKFAGNRSDRIGATTLGARYSF
jgi:opacity protein-like surface antigen